MRPCPELLVACRKKYPYYQATLPLAYGYVVMMAESPYYTLNDNLGKIIQQTMCQQLQLESFKNTNLGRFTHIALALQREVLIRCDMFFDMSNYSRTTYDILSRGIVYCTAVMERFEPNYGSTEIREEWLIEFSFRDFRPRASRVGTLEALIRTFNFVTL